MAVRFHIGRNYAFTFTVGAVITHPEQYPGPYTVTPGAAVQTLPTSGLALTQNVTVNPIPSNYGLISYNGYGLTVS